MATPVPAELRCLAAAGDDTATDRLVAAERAWTAQLWTIRQERTPTPEVR